MSRKYTKQSRSFPWLLVALGGLLILASLFLFSSRDKGTPVVTVDQELIDFGDVKLDTPLFSRSER